MTSCQLSLKRNSGPLSAQATTSPSATRKARGVPTVSEIASANLLKRSFTPRM